MEWDVLFTDEFGEWWDSLSVEEQEDVAAYVGMLQKAGPRLKHPYSSGVQSSRHKHMRELRIQHGGRPYRVLYAFDPKRSAILLVGGDKTGNDRWYEIYVPLADRLYDEHAASIANEGEHTHGSEKLQGTAGKNAARVPRKKRG